MEGVKGRRQKTLVQLLHGCIYLTLQTVNKKYTKHQSAFLILLLRFKFYLPFFQGILMYDNEFKTNGNKFKLN